MDKIILQRMQFYGNHGVFAEEKKLGQRFYVDVTLHLDLAAAGASDNLEDTINYASVYHTIRDIVELKTFNLIESLAEHIASEVLDSYTKVDELTVSVIKPHPPFDIHFEGVTVELHRKRV